MFKKYYDLTKPGIIYGNLLSTVGGFLLASRGSVNLFLFVETLLGLGLVIASGCVFNNVIDRKIDERMERTRKRALVTGTISVRNALFFGFIMGIFGFYILFYSTNLLTVALAAIGLIFYVAVYGYAKRHSYLSTLVGSIPGAVPITVGYCAITNTFDTGALLLFLAMVVWQMPHFYAISIFRRNDYKNASLPVLSVTRGVLVTKKHILFFSVLYVVAMILLTAYKITGFVFLSVMILLSSNWVWYGVRGFRTKDSEKWARGMFGLSLINLLLFSLMLSLDMVLH